jgi:hypothetical protein
LQNILFNIEKKKKQKKKQLTIVREIEEYASLIIIEKLINSN